MRKNDRKFFHMPEVEKQKTPLPNEVSLKDAFTKLSVSAAHAADQYTLNIYEKNTKKQRF